MIRQASLYTAGSWVSTERGAGLHWQLKSNSNRQRQSNRRGLAAAQTFPEFDHATVPYLPTRRPHNLSTEERKDGQRGRERKRKRKRDWPRLRKGSHQCCRAVLMCSAPWNQHVAAFVFDAWRSSSGGGHGRRASYGGSTTRSIPRIGCVDTDGCKQSAQPT